MKKLHEEYYDAGADVSTTNNFVITEHTLRKYFGDAAQLQELTQVRCAYPNQRSVALNRARDDCWYVGIFFACSACFMYELLDSLLCSSRLTPIEPLRLIIHRLLPLSLPRLAMPAQLDARDASSSSPAACHL